jgi:uncharacterized protein (TIGR03089 family)
MAAAPATFADVLALRLRRDPGRPLVTWYDVATGERVELSVTTYANWVAKAASLLADEHDLERGTTLRVDLPPHWLGPVFLGAAWSAGLVVTFSGEADAVVCGPDTVASWAGRADDIAVLACSLLPMGVRFVEPLPAGTHDVGVEIWSQPDAFFTMDPPGPDDVAVVLDGSPLTHRELWEGAAAGSLPSGGRLLTEANPASPPGLAAFAEPLARGGSLVIVRHAGPAEVREIAAAERATLLPSTSASAPPQPGPS